MPKTTKSVTFYSRDPSDALDVGDTLKSDIFSLNPDQHMVDVPGWAVAARFEGYNDEGLFFICDRESIAGTSEYVLIGVAPNRVRVDLNVSSMGKDGNVRTIQRAWRRDGQIPVPGYQKPKFAATMPDDPNLVMPTPPKAPRVGRFLDVASL